MTLHSQTPFNVHNEDMGRDFVMPMKPVLRWTAKETRALEDWWIRSIPGAGKCRKGSHPIRRFRPSRFERFRRELEERGPLKTRDLHRIHGGSQNATANTLAHYFSMGWLKKEVVKGAAIWSLPEE